MKKNKQEKIMFIMSKKIKNSHSKKILKIIIITSL